MLAIYVKEIKQYFHSMIGFAFLAFFLLVIGIYTWAYNLNGGYGNFELTLGSISFLFVLLIPILTMRIIAEENHQKTNQLLYTAPVSVTKIVLAKFFALLTLFGIGIIVTGLYPLLISRYSEDMSLASSYSSILGFFLLGAACIAICMLISALTESQAIAAVVSFIVLLVSFLMSNLTGMLPEDALSQCVMLAVLWLAFVLFIQKMLVKLWLVAGLAAVGEAAIWIVYFVKASVYEGFVTKLLNMLAVSTRFEDFSMGILNYDAIVYYLSIIVFFVFLTIQVIRSQQYKAGIYSSVVTVLALAVVVMANMMFSRLELSTDLTPASYFTLSKDTKEALGEIKDDVTVNYMVSDGQENQYIEKILNQYGKISGHIKIKRVDPVVNPGFADKVGVEDTVENNDAIVVNQRTGKACYVSNTDMFVQDMDYYTGNSQESLDVEGQITAAIQKVLSDKATKVYVMTKHSEIELGSGADDIFEKMNMETAQLELATQKKVPDDCDILLVNGPSSDLTDREKEMVLDYLDNGGRAMLNVLYTKKKLSNYEEILKHYGIRLVNGEIFEGAGNYVQYVNWIQPFASEETDLLKDLNGYIVFPGAMGMTVDEKDAKQSGVTVTEILGTSDDSFAKVNPSNEELGKEDGDIDGPFSVGLLVKKAKEDADGSEDGQKDEEAEDEAALFVYSAAGAFSEDFLQTSGLDNADLLKKSLSEMSASDIREVSVAEKSLSYSYVSMPAGSQLFWAAVLVVIIPAGLLIMGFAIWFTRRRVPREAASNKA